MKILLLLVLCSCAPKNSSAFNPTADPKLNQVLSLQLPQLGQPGPWTLASQKGRVVLLDVWATWCDPCLGALSAYQQLKAELHTEEFMAFGISVDAEPAVIGPFLKTNHLSIPVLLDPEAKVTSALLKIGVMPTAVLIDKAGVVRFRHEGFDADELTLLRKEITVLMAENMRSTSSTQTQ
jgi:cytochrome c biogenesis protein CcmG, thiol:disulfide interchange protein DsbE